jgi:S1-C subfamily serine protease
VIRVNATGLHVATFGNSSTLQQAQTVLAIGNPLGLQQTVTSGVVSAIHRVVDEPGANGSSVGAYLPDAIQISAPINPGNSGGALAALDGTVVGIPTLGLTDTGEGTAAQGIGFAISSARVKVVVPQLIQDGKVIHTGRAYLGVGLTDTQASGAQVSNLDPNGPAATAGVQHGDIITSIDGHPITSSNDVRIVLAMQKPGDQVNLTINRNGQTLQLQVTLGELPASSG